MSRRVLDLFSGIGGFSIGLERAGMRTVAFCEIDAYCRSVLRKHWPDVPCYTDVRDVTGSRLAADGIVPDLVCGGFPCQDISFAGKGAGLDGARSGLWFEYRRIIEEVRPSWIIIENVSALRSRGLDVVLGQLAALGYDAEWHCIPASAVGAPHRRDRIWIVAYPARLQPGRPEQRAERERAGAGGQSQPVAHSDQHSGLTRRPSDANEGSRGRNAGGSGVGADVADAIGAGLEGRPRLAGYLAQQLAAIERGGAGQAMGGPARELPYRSRSSSEQAGWREPSDASWWLSEPDVGGSPDGFPSWLDRCIGRGMSYAESRDAAETLRHLWSPHVSQALRRAAGGLERVQQAEVLFAFLRQYQAGADEARLLVAGQEASETFLRGLRECATASGASRRPGSKQQRSVEHPDALQVVPRLLACDSEAAWAGSGWEDAIPRIATSAPSRVARLRALGNAVVPQIPEIIGRAIIAAEEASAAA